MSGTLRVSADEPHGSARPSGVRPGVVYLVGAGPGDPGLITVAGLAALRRADVVVYDRLAAPELLREAPSGATLIDAGKAPGVHTLGQTAINAVLAEHALAGRTVVRLKGGDPFLFGRGGEEAEHLRGLGVPVRVIPGVTSAIAAPACAGIPVTHRGVSDSVLILTGHAASNAEREPAVGFSPGTRNAEQIREGAHASAPLDAVQDEGSDDRSRATRVGEAPDEIAGAAADTFGHNWQAIANAADTLVVLMGVERLEAVTTALLAAGRPAEQPAALVRWGSTPEQETLVATLGGITSAARERGLRPPATLVVGDVVALRERLDWQASLPLAGARVLVTRAREQASGLVARLRELGATPLELPAIRCRSLDDPASLDAALKTLAEQDWVVFTSQNGVSAVMERLRALGRDARAFAGARLCAIGTATAEALSAHGLRADLVPERFTTDGVLVALTAAGVQGRRVLLLRADIAPPALADGLRAAGARVTSVAAYHTEPAAGRRTDLDRLLARGLDIATFTSSSTVTNLLDALGGDTIPLATARIAAIGPATAATLRAAGLPVHAEAEPHTIEGLMEAVVRLWEGRSADRVRS